MDSRPATVNDLLGNLPEGWREDHEGTKRRSRLDPTKLAEHFRLIGAAYAQIPNPTGVTIRVDTGLHLEVLWLALAERGWEIDRQDAVDAWFLAAWTPNEHW